MDRWRNLTGVAVAIAMIGGTLSACGSSDESSTSTSSGGSSTTASTAAAEPAETAGNPAVDAAKEKVATWSAEQEPIAVPPVGEPIPEGKDIAVVTCPLPVCQTETKAADRAAKALGWTTKNYNNPLTPEGYVSVWKDILQQKPDGIIYVGVLPNAVVKDQIAEAASMDIPMIVMAPAGDKPSAEGPVYASYAGAPNFGLSGELMADTIVADNGPDPKTALVWDKTLALTLGEERKRFVGGIEAAGGSVEIIDVSSQEIGKAIPGQIVSFVQSNPDVKYIAFQLNDFTAGVPQALTAAGVSDKVKIISRAPQSTHLADIKAGNQFAAIAEENDAGGYRSIDALVRIFLGKDDYEMEPAGWHQIITQDNVDAVQPDAAGAPSTPGSPDTFLEAWGVAGQ